jgi:hypothetical protein
MFTRVFGVLFFFVSATSVAMSDDADKARAMLERVVIELKKTRRSQYECLRTARMDSEIGTSTRSASGLPMVW